MKKFTCIDLFSGAGGLSKGFLDAGYNVVLGVDFDDAALKTFECNHGCAKAMKLDLFNHDNIDVIISYLKKQKIELDVLVGGPPCQGFSIAGPRDMNDKRNSLYMAMVKLAERIKPKAIVLENVPGMIQTNNGIGAKRIIDDFSKLGYTMTAKILYAPDYGIPQIRKRVFFVGLLNSEQIYEYPLPTCNPDKYVTCEDAIGDLPALINVYGEEVQDYECSPLTDYKDTKGVGINKIFYGTPGCGKSYHIDHKILGKDTATKEYTGDYDKDNIIRTTFYQDYSNTDFVGQILPKVVKGDEGEKDTVEYIFNPGPFTLALIQAISNPTKKVALVIEEINRGNAPAIFGDIFQLLDRDDNSISEYGIVNVGLMDYLNGYEFTVNDEKKRYSFADIKIPGNMDIFATMNTSDQNVYTLDTAFVRRWEKEKIKNTFDECDFKGEPVPGMSDYTWKEFVESINKWIARNIDSLQVNEDKQIGAFFVKKSLLTKNDPEKFAYKVFDYLWNDVAKLDHDIFFNSYNTLEDLIDAYKEKGVGVFKTGIFDAKVAIAEREEENDEQ